MRPEPKINPGMKTRIGARPYRVTTVLGRDSRSPSDAFPVGQAPELPHIDSPATNDFESSLASDAAPEFETPEIDKEGSFTPFDAATVQELVFLVKIGSAKKPAVRTCRMDSCSEPATKAIIWADGRAAFHVCPNHVGPGKEFLEKKNGDWAEIVAVRNYDASAAEGKRYSPGNGKEKKAAAPALRKGPGEFAPGIAGDRGIHSIPKVRPRAGNQEWTAALSMHPAARRGDHHDLRLVDPKGRAHSWAFQDVPAPGKSTYAVQQPTHKKRYALRDKPFTIPEGYGATRPGAQVEPKFVSGVEVVEAGNDKIRFLKHEGQQTEEFVLRKLTPSMGSVRPMFALHNATKNRGTGEGKRIPSSKPKYKEIAPEAINLDDPEQVMTPKLDGAHVLVDLPGTGDKFARVYSYRPTARETGLIEHTFKFKDFQKRRGSETVKNTMVRAECWATDKDGKAIPAEQLGGLLNAGVLKSRKKQEEMGVKLRLTGFDVVRHNGRNMEKKPFAEKLEVLNKVNKATRGFIEVPEVASTPEQKKKMLMEIKERARKDTDEGVVLHTLDKAEPPVKAKFKPDVDVFVRRVFDKPRGAAKGHAGGFEYSFTPDGPIIGRVGTGFDHAARKDMMTNPEKYVGRVAKVKSVRNSENRTDPSQMTKALRAPSFKGWHLDKTDPKLMEDDYKVLEKKAVAEQLRQAWLQVQQSAQPERIIDEAMSRSARLKQLKPVIRDATGSVPIPQGEVHRWIQERVGADASVDS